MKNVLMAFYALLACTTVNAQASSTQQIKVINIINDTVFASPLVVDNEKVIINGNFKKITFATGTQTKFVIKSGTLLVKNATVLDKKNWGTVGDQGYFQWYGIGMKGSMGKNLISANTSTYIDGMPMQ